MRPGRLSLRARLLAELLALLAAVCVIIGVVTELALRDFLEGQLDQQLVSTSQRLGDRPPEEGVQAPPGGGPSPPGGGSPEGRPPPPEGRQREPVLPGELLEMVGGPVGTVSARVVNGTVEEAVYLDASGTAQPLPVEYHGLFQSMQPGDPPRTEVFRDLGEYRIVATTDHRGNVQISGLPLIMIDVILVRLRLIMIVVALIGLALAGVAGALIVRFTLRPLTRVADAARQVAELQLHKGEVALPVRVPDQDTDLRTEVGKVGSALNRMLGHVAAALTARQASETRVRQFVADASHELRTPLAAIRGYAELAARNREEVPADVAYALRRVESETARMTTLVNDLLLLARLDAGRPLASEPVDLSRVVVDATSDAHVAGPEHRWRLDLPEDSIVVQGDEAQLHHVLGNLLANARTHTPAGTTVLVRLGADGDGHALLTVTDDGPGIPPKLLPEVFDRFARGDSSRSRAAGSTGLGLAIVSAVVHALDGTVEVASEPGCTTFTVRLPLVPNGHPVIDGSTAVAAADPAARPAG